MQTKAVGRPSWTSGSWLRTLGLERFEATFRENAIDETVLSDLTEDHLRELGLPLGARIKLLKAIAALPTKTTVGAPAGMAVSSSPGDAAERRQVTVMFCDLVGSTAMSVRMDPEDLARDHFGLITNPLPRPCGRLGGFVAKYMGDGVLVYFGYPKAHEDDAETRSAGRTGLIEVVGKAEQTNTQLQTRVGIATGLVVVGDLDRMPARPRSEASSARRPTSRPGCKGVAEPDKWLLSRTSQEGFWAICSSWRDLGHRGVSRDMAGCGRRSGLHCVTERPWKAGLKPFTVANLSSLVGREEELQIAAAALVQSQGWAKARSVLISGEAGIGKSRLTAGVAGTDQ